MKKRLSLLLIAMLAPVAPSAQSCSKFDLSIFGMD
jgi:hypothetical protein